MPNSLDSLNSSPQRSSSVLFEFPDVALERRLGRRIELDDLVVEQSRRGLGDRFDLGDAFPHEIPLHLAQ